MYLALLSLRMCVQSSLSKHNLYVQVLQSTIVNKSVHQSIMCKFQRMYRMTYSECTYCIFKRRKTNNSMQSPLSNCELHLFYFDTAYEPVGNIDWFSLKIVPFHVTFFLCCCSKAESMATGVLVTHIQALAGLARGSSRVLNNKTFVFSYHVFLCKYKRVPLHLST